ncbi:MAG: glycosyltransferase family 1 protein [Alphaproteobacteria bacterium]
MSETRTRRFLIISDAWHAQINGVVRTLEMTVRELEKLGHSARVVGPEPETNLTFALPGYASIRLEFFAAQRIGKIIEDFAPDFIHIATEGPLGWAARHVCLTRRLAFTTAYHTCFPEYVAARVAQYLPQRCALWAQRFGYAVMRHFHAPAGAVLVGTPSIEDLLRRNGFNPTRLRRWSRGVDVDVFRPEAHDPTLYAQLPRPVALYVGRVAIEKNIRAFLDAAIPGSKVVVGGGPQLGELTAAYPHVRFVGEIHKPEQLAPYYAGADALVFPSQTDTFGLVMLEAMACGLPVAAYPAPGPQDIAAAGATHEFFRLDTDLAAATRALCATNKQPQAARAFVTEHYSWHNCTAQFVLHAAAAEPPPRRKFWHVILTDYVISLPGQLYNYGGVRQIIWGGRKIWETLRKVSEQYFK